jgi:hypothetical protein
MGLRVVVTGSSGFLGGQLAASLLAAPHMVVCGRAAPIEQLRLVDRAGPPSALAADARTAAVVVDLSSSTADLSFMDGADVVFHLAAAVSADCEGDFDLGCTAIYRPRSGCCNGDGRRRGCPFWVWHERDLEKALMGLTAPGFGAHDCERKHLAR